MKKVSEKIMIVLLIVFVIGLAGCAKKSGPETKSKETGAPLQKVENSQPLPVDSKVDQGKANESENFFEQGLKFYEQYNYREANVRFDQAIAANPANFKVYTAKGIALCFEGNYQDGIAMIQKTLDMKPDYVPAFYDMAMACKLQNKYDQSLYWFTKTIQGDPENTWSYYGIATIHADQGNAQESLKYLKKAIELDPGVKEVAKEQSHFAKMRNLPEFQALVR